MTGSGTDFFANAAYTNLSNITIDTLERYNVNERRAVFVINR
jgi:hypothetical protein